MEKFSVLMTVYIKDSAENVEIAFRSVVDQTVKPSQVVVVFDGPVKPEVSNFFRENIYQVDLYTIEKNVGLARALNYGLEKCKYDVVARMDSDDVSLPGRFQLMLPKLLEEVALVGASYEIYDEDLDEKLGERILPAEHSDIVKLSRIRTPINHPTIIFRKSAVLSVGGYPENIGRFEDWGLALRLISSGYTLSNMREVVLKFRGGQQMLSRRHGWEYALEEFRALYLMHKEGLLRLRAFARNVFLRFPVRIAPYFLVRFVYSLIHR